MEATGGRRRLALLPGRSIVPVDYQKNGCNRVRGSTIGGAEEGRKRYGREVPPTLAGGGKTGGRVCGRVVAGGLPTVNVLAPGEGEMTTGGMFVEPQFPMTHLQAREPGSAIAGGMQPTGFDGSQQWAIGRRR